MTLNNIMLKKLGQQSERVNKKYVIIAVVVVVGVLLAVSGGVYLYKKSTKDEEIQEAFIPETPEEILDYATEIANDHQNYTEAEKMYYDLIRNKQAGPEVYYYLAEINYSKARGDRDPCLEKAANLYKQAILMGYVDCMVKLADIYNFCTIPGTDIPNKNVSKALYQKVIRNSKVSKEAKITANLRLVELNRDTAMKNMNKTTRLQRTMPDDQILREHKIPNGPAYNVRAINVPQDIPNIIKNDSQNVHERQIQQAFTNGIQKLKKINGYNQKAIPQRDIVQQIEQYVKNCMDLPQDIKTKAQATIAVMKANNESITAANGMRETEVLGLVWNRIHARENAKNIDNLKDAFARELADAAINGTPVCPTGRVTRALNALEGMDARDDVVRFRPKWALKEEIQGNAARVRDDILQEATDEEQEAYENDGAGSARAQNLAVVVTERMKNELLKRCTSEYVKQGLMKKEELETELVQVNAAF